MFNNTALCCFRSRLEYYEQSCAVDSLTKKCAGPPSECRKAMLGILGTELRSNCACKGTDFTQLYDCLGWQRLLWVNPCVGQYIAPPPPVPHSFPQYVKAKRWGSTTNWALRLKGTWLKVLYKEPVPLIFFNFTPR
jgi:hypothetical protein